MNRAVNPCLLIEVLETRQLRASVFPTAQEQLMVELINRARANPQGEADYFNGYSDDRGVSYDGDLNEGLAPGTITNTPKQPVAINLNLTDAARSHSQWMGTNHIKSHTGVNSSGWAQRIATAGYTGATASDENIDIKFSLNALNLTDTTQKQHASFFTDTTLAGRGHRVNIENNTFKEVGVGITTNTWNLPNGINNSQEATINFASRGTTFLTGVAYTDKVTTDSFYTVGEGLSGITVKATRKSDSKVFTTTTWTSGGYSLALAAGTYDVQASGGSLGTVVKYSNVVISSQNVKRDFISGKSGDADNFAKIVDGVLVVTGTTGADKIGISLVGANYVVAMNGKSMTFASSGITKIGVKAGAGNDVISNNTNTASYLEGSDGKDHIVGGGGEDAIYGDGSPDYIDGGAGNDVLVGSGGGDFVQGGAGNDKIYGGAGNDIINGGANNDRVFGGDGNDSISGVNGNDVLYGELGADNLNGGGNTDASDNDPLDTRIAVELFV